MAKIRIIKTVSFMNIKMILPAIFMIISPALVFAQQSDLSEKWVSELLTDKYMLKEHLTDSLCVRFNLENLWTKTESEYIFGFIGSHYERISVHFDKITKDITDPYRYIVHGKTMVKGNVCLFNGSINIRQVRGYNKELTKTRIPDYNPVTDTLLKTINYQGLLIADCLFKEDPNLLHSGIFKGVLTTAFYVSNDNKIHYDSLGYNSGSYSNNQFVGLWISYDGKIIHRCHWGDFRIPYSDDLDIGAGEFHPASKYLDYGWEAFKPLNTGNRKQP